MTPRRRRGAYLALLAVGTAALVADRWLFSDKGAVTEPALALGQVEPQAARPALNGDSPPAPSIPELPFPHDLPAPDGEETVRDLFAPPNRVLARKQSDPLGPQPASDKKTGEGELVDRDTFVTGHRLHGILADKGLKIAVVDGAWVQVGEPFGGCMLMEVEGNKVRFQCHDGEAELSVSRLLKSPPH